MNLKNTVDKILNLSYRLDGFEIINEDAKVIQNFNGKPNIIFLSSTNDFKKYFPEGLKLTDNYIKIEEPQTREKNKKFIQNSDIIIWAMNSLKMFPGEYSDFVDTAREENIPVLSIITGFNLINEKENFINKLIPKNKSKLPEHSDFFIIKDQSDVLNQINSINKLITEKGSLLAERGYVRRLNSFKDKSNEMLFNNRKTINNDLNILNRRIDTAQLGIESFKIMIQSDVEEIFSDYLNFDFLFDDFQNLLLEVFNDTECDFDLIKIKISESLKIYTSETLEEKFKELNNHILNKSNKWCEESSLKLKGIFSTFIQSSKSPEDINNYLKINKKEIYQKVDIIIRDYNKIIRDKFGALSNVFNDDFILKLFVILGKEVPIEKILNSLNIKSLNNTQFSIEQIENIRKNLERSRADLLISDQFEILRNEMKISRKLIKEKLTEFFRDIIQSHSNSCLAIINNLISEPRDILKKLDLAEKILITELKEWD